MTRDSLFNRIRENLQQAEDAIGAIGERFDRPALPRLEVETLDTPGDICRRLTEESQSMPARIRALLATGTLPSPRDEQIADGIAKFASLDRKMLAIELDSAHATFWAYVKQFNDEDLAQTFTISGEEQTLDEVIQNLVRHEVEHVNEALAAAGGQLTMMDYPHHTSYAGDYSGTFTLRTKGRTGSHRHPELEMIAADDAGDGRHFATLVYISGEWALNLDGRNGMSLATYPTREEAWEAARRDYARAACEYCGATGYRRPRRRRNGWSPRPYWVCARCWKIKERKQDALMRRTNSNVPCVDLSGKLGRLQSWPPKRRSEQPLKRRRPPTRSGCGRSITPWPLPRSAPTKKQWSTWNAPCLTSSLRRSQIRPIPGGSERGASGPTLRDGPQCGSHSVEVDDGS